MRQTVVIDIVDPAGHRTEIERPLHNGWVCLHGTWVQPEEVDGRLVIKGVPPPSTIPLKTPYPVNIGLGLLPMLCLAK